MSELSKVICVLGRKLIFEKDTKRYIASIPFKNRLSGAALSFMREEELGNNPLCIVSGGSPEEEFNSRNVKTESEVGIEFLLKTNPYIFERAKGEGRLIAEPYSKDTIWNAINVGHILEERDLLENPLELYSSTSHISRVRKIFSFLLGNEDITYVGTATGFSTGEYSEHLKAEINKFHIFEQFVKDYDFEPGDYKRVESILRNKVLVMDEVGSDLNE
jgi:hypothetical protein